ncbi:MAG: bifunctional metallophosphatase/5'-nucleotidase [Spirochaetes bacterium]|nr:bifunctional metallophosphatase/5'-nucleotidase [Spirochaetota bacterium]
MKVKSTILFSVFTLLFLMAACKSQPEVVKSDYQAGPVAFTLQLLHYADVDGNEEIALTSVDKFSAIVDAFKKDEMYGKNTLLVSSGDIIITGPRFYAAEQSSVRKLTGSNEPGHADIAFANYMGVTACALGNHELDAGPGEFVDALSSEKKGDAVFPGSLFPYLAANVDFSTDRDTAEMIGDDGMDTEALKGKLAKSAVANVNGEMVGLVGAVTPTMVNITNTGGMTINPSASNYSIADLAAIIQPEVDALVAKGVNKIIILAHMQQISVEKELARLLNDVDIIVAGGSNTRMGDKNDKLYPGDSKFDEAYPYSTADADGKPILVVNVDGDYKYLGRLVVGFDADGVIATDTLDESLNGSWASTDENIKKLGGTPNSDVVALRDTIKSVITAQYGNVVGYTNVYLDGRRSQVRTQETNLGNLTADANLWYANLLSETKVDVSIKNGGGIRTEIGSAVVPPGSVDYSEAVLNPPAPNEEAGTGEGAITEGHLRATLRFDNGLVTLTATAEELKNILEHAIAQTAEGATPGRFPQIAGMKLAFDASKDAGNRIISLDVLNEDGTVKDTVVADGAVQGDAMRTFRLVTLNFLANGGDGFPFTELSSPDRYNLYEGKGYGEEVDYPDGIFSNDPGQNNSFSSTGGEQDALAEYLLEFHATPKTGYDKAETDRNKDMRIKY